MASAGKCSALSVAYLALGPAISLFALWHAGLLQIPPLALAVTLCTCGTLQIVCALQMRQDGQVAGAAIFIPFGLFCFSLVGFYPLPVMGIGRSPAATSLLIYLTLWGLFAALLYLSSFRQGRIYQFLFCSLMICLLLLAISELRDNPVFDGAAALAGGLFGLSALYTGLAPVINKGLGRDLLPAVSSATMFEGKVE